MNKQNLNLPVDRFYFYNSCKSDTTFFDKPSFDTTGLVVLTTKEFLDSKFQGYVIKLSNDPAPIDGRSIYFVTPEFGIVFQKSTTWSCYKRLHSTNDSIDNKISRYRQHTCKYQTAVNWRGRIYLLNLLH